MDLEEGEEAGCVGQTLPELTSELLSAYTTQSSELQLKEKCLQQLDSELLELQRQLQAVSGDVSSTVRSICLQEDLLARLGRECEGLESGVLALVQERENLQLQLHHLKEEKQLQDKMRAEYESKMQSYESKVEQLEKLSPTQVELEALRNKIQALKEKREEYYTAAVGPVLSVERQQCLQDQVAALMASRVALRQENSVLEEKLAAKAETIECLQKEAETGRKRQAAQLKCLRRLLNEAQAQRRQWGKKAEGIRASIWQLQQRIED